MTIQRNPNMKTPQYISKRVVTALLLTSAAVAFGQVGISNSSTAHGLGRTLEPNSSVRSAICVNGIVWAVSCNGKLLTTSNEVDWTEVRLPCKTFFRGITFGDTLFVVVGGSYIDQPGVILTSRDGTNWTLRRSGTRANLYGVTHGNGIFVAVGDNHTILTSKNGITWKQRTPATSDMLLSSIVFGNGVFVAVGDSGTVLISSDTLHWHARNSGTSAYLSKVRYEAGGFVATRSKVLPSHELPTSRGYRDGSSTVALVSVSLDL
jgi:hypothetical protein